MTDETRKEKILHAEAMAAYWLSLGNEAEERGEKEKAERHFERAEKWQDKMNELLGDQWPSW